MNNVRFIAPLTNPIFIHFGDEGAKCLWNCSNLREATIAAITQFYGHLRGTGISKKQLFEQVSSRILTTTVNGVCTAIIAEETWPLMCGIVEECTAMDLSDNPATRLKQRLGLGGNEVTEPQPGSDEDFVRFVAQLDKEGAADVH